MILVSIVLSVLLTVGLNLLLRWPLTRTAARLSAGEAPAR